MVIHSSQLGDTPRQYAADAKTFRVFFTEIIGGIDPYHWVSMPFTTRAEAADFRDMVIEIPGVVRAEIRKAVDWERVGETATS